MNAGEILSQNPILVRIDREEIEDSIREFDINTVRKKDLNNGLFMVRQHDIIMVFNIDNICEAVISEYELSNPFLFNNVLICPGHDSVTCYDIMTKESKTGYIR